MKEIVNIDRIHFCLVLAFLLLSGSCLAIAELIALNDFPKLIFFNILAFSAYFFVLRNFQSINMNPFLLSLLVRVPLIFLIPTLSTDIYRFLWDGEIMHLGYNPYLYTPDFLIETYANCKSTYLAELHQGMGALSQENHSIYPSLNQAIFWITTHISDSVYVNVFFMHLLLIIGDLFTIRVLQLVLKKLNINPNRSWIYAFNPLVICEISGALHFEGLMLLFLLIAINLWLSNKWILGAILFSFAVQMKLIPLLLLPFLLPFAGFKNAIVSYIFVGSLILIETFILMPIYAIPSFLYTLQLYFGRFEYNSGIYVFFKFYAKWKVGYFRLKHYAPFLSKLATLAVLFVAFLRRRKDAHSWLSGMFGAMMIYYFFVPIVHPWYIILPFALSLMTTYSAGILWSMLIPVSYYYYFDTFSVVYYVLVALEFLMVFGVLFYEYYTKKRIVFFRKFLITFYS